MAVEHLSKGNDDGTVFGQSSTDKIAFYNATPISLRSAPASIGTSATTAILKAAINKINTLLKLIGLSV